MKQAVLALKGDWEEYEKKKKKTSSESKQMPRNGPLIEHREAFEKVAKDEAGRLNIVQGIMLKSADFLRRIIAPAGGQGGVTMSYLCPNCSSFPWRTPCGGFQLSSWWCGLWRKSVIGRRPTDYWWYKQVTVSVRQRCSKRMCRKVKTKAAEQKELLETLASAGHAMKRATVRWKQRRKVAPPHRGK